MAAPTTPPEAPKFDAQTKSVFVNRVDVYEYKALAAYSEPAWVIEFVNAGKLPPVAGRLPAEPLVFKTATALKVIDAYTFNFTFTTGSSSCSAGASSKRARSPMCWNAPPPTTPAAW